MYSDDNTEIAQLQTSIRYVVGESNSLVQDEHDSGISQTVLNGLDAPLQPFKVALMTTFIVNELPWP